MAEYNGNDIYLRINAVNVQARWREFDIQFSSDTEDVSAGAGVLWQKNAPKLFSAKATIKLIYDDVAAATDFAALWQADQVFTVIYGPEGNAAGKPKHEQDFKINSIKGPTTTFDKSKVLLEYDLISTGVPVSNIYAGGAF